MKNFYHGFDEAIWNPHIIVTKKNHSSCPVNKIIVHTINTSTEYKYPTIEDVKVIAPEKVVEVTFSDGTKEKSVCGEPDKFSLETAISICLSKKMMGGSSAYNKAVKRGVKVYNDRIKKEAVEKAERECAEKKRVKREEYKKRKAARKKEEQIEVQAEAYVRAMKILKENENSTK